MNTIILVGYLLGLLVDWIGLDWIQISICRLSAHKATNLNLQIDLGLL
jgi:hypothetical protein